MTNATPDPAQVFNAIRYIYDESRYATQAEHQEVCGAMYKVCQYLIDPKDQELRRASLFFWRVLLGDLYPSLTKFVRVFMKEEDLYTRARRLLKHLDLAEDYKMFLGEKEAADELLAWLNAVAAKMLELRLIEGQKQITKQAS